MGKVIRYEYVGGSFGAIYMTVAFASVVFIPIAAKFFIENIIHIEEEIENPEEFMEAFRAGRLQRGSTS